MHDPTGQGLPFTTASVHLRLLATTDLHAHLLPFDYFTDTRAPEVGLARLAGAICAARAAAPNSLLFDNGDTLQGTPLADVAVAEVVPGGDRHPMIAAMNAMGFDAATLGNHDFDFGLPHLCDAFAGADFPVVCASANLPDGTPFFPRTALLERTVTDDDGIEHPITVGVTGCVPPQVAAWNRPAVEGRLTFTDMRTAVADATVALRDGGADIVVVLAHSGMGNLIEGEGAENVALQIAEIDGVDAVIAGHTHHVFPDTPPGPVTGTPVVQPGALGSHLGCIDLSLTRSAHRWSVTAAATGTFAGAPPDRQGSAVRGLIRTFPSLYDDLSQAHRTTRAFVSRPLGASAVPLETYFSLIAPCAATQVVADAQIAAIAPTLAENSDLRDLPLLSAVAPFKAGGRAGPGSYVDIPAGALMLRHAAELYIYPNMLSLLRITGQGVRDWLERSASIYHRIDPDGAAPQPLINHEFAPYNFDRLTGVRYKIDVSRSACTNAEGDEVFETPGRIRDLTFADGRPFGAEDQALVVTNSYRAAGGGHMAAAAAAQPVRINSLSVRDAVAQYISDAGVSLDPVVDPCFTLMPLGGVPVVVETGPGALDHGARLAELGLGVTDQGASAAPESSSGAFAAFTLTL